MILQPLEMLGSISEENMKQDMPVTSDGNLKKHIREEHDAKKRGVVKFSSP